MAIRITQKSQWVPATESEVERTGAADTIESLWNGGTWGDVVREDVVRQRVPVIGLAVPKVAKATATAKFSLANKKERGITIKVFIATLGMSKSYTLTQDLELECSAGQTQIAGFKVPVQHVVRRFLPSSGGEWLERDLYYAMKPDPNWRGLETFAAVVPLEKLSHPAGAPMELDGGDISTKATTSTEQVLSFSVGVELGFGNSDISPVTAGSIGLTFGVEATVGTEVSYDLPGLTNLYWLSPLAGAAIVKP